MSNLILEARVTGTRLDINPTQLASGSSNVVQIRFIFDELHDPTWTGFGKTAVFYRQKDEVYHVLLVDNIATVPREVLAEEGFFFFGLMGSKGAAIHTTEVVRLTVHQGAITTPTNEPEDHTPNVYEQLLEVYHVQQTRLNELVAMRGTTGEVSYSLQDEGLSEGRIVSNGYSATIFLVFDGLSLMGGWENAYSTEAFIPPNLAPQFNLADNNYWKRIKLETYHPDLEVYIEPVFDEWYDISTPNVSTYTGWACVRVLSNSDEVVNVYGVRCSGQYPLATPFNSEVADARVDFRGKVWPTLGDHLRGLLAELLDAGGGRPSFVTDVTLYANKWVGSASPYSQVVTVNGATEQSQVDLTPSVEQLAIFHSKDLAFVTENEDGVITVYAIGQKPTNDYTIQATVTEVIA